MTACFTTDVTIGRLLFLHSNYLKYWLLGNEGVPPEVPGFDYAEPWTHAQLVSKHL